MGMCYWTCVESVSNGPGSEPNSTPAEVHELGTTSCIFSSISQTQLSQTSQARSW